MGGAGDALTLKQQSLPSLQWICLEEGSLGTPLPAIIDARMHRTSTSKPLQTAVFFPGLTPSQHRAHLTLLVTQVRVLWPLTEEK